MEVDEPCIGDWSGTSFTPVAAMGASASCIGRSSPNKPRKIADRNRRSAICLMGDA